jgi:hypothetical protein
MKYLVRFPATRAGVGGDAYLWFDALMYPRLDPKRERATRFEDEEDAQFHLTYAKVQPGFHADGYLEPVIEQG